MEKFINSYAELKKQKPRTLKSVARNTALDALSILTDKKLFAIPRIQFIYIHHLFKDEEQQFRKLLQLLSKDHEFISYSDAVNKILTCSIDKPYITFSSDDGLKNNLRAAEILNEVNARSCFFINPGIIGETDYNKLHRFCSDALRFPTVHFLNWDEVDMLQRYGHEIGSHTMMHMNIAETPDDVVQEDLYKTYEILKEKCGDVKHFAFPYGRFFHFSSAGRKMVYDAGFFSCATAERGCHINPLSPMRNDELCIRRDHTVLGWSMNHILYFLINNAKNASVSNNFYPDTLK